jgi:hypothetical protein
VWRNDLWREARRRLTATGGRWWFCGKHHFQIQLIADGELIEYVCNENNPALPRLMGK